LSPIIVLVAGRKYRALFWKYALTALAFDVISYTARHLGIVIPGWGNLFALVEFLFLISYYRKVIDRKIVFNMVCALLGIFYVVHTLFLRSYNQAIPFNRLSFNLTGISVLYLFYITLAIIGFYKIVTGPLVDNIMRSSFFWVNVTFIIYASGVFFMFIFGDTIRSQDIALGAMLWSTIFCGLNITKNMLLAKALSVNDGAVEP
jgi:hypothetical protein